jgi:hypothetical protein
MYVECRKKFLRSKFWVSVCVLRAICCWVGVSGSVFAVLGCASMLVSVTFDVGMRDVGYVDRLLCGERNFARRRQLSPYTFFYQGQLAESCMRVVVRVFQK